MSQGLFKNVIYKICLEIIYFIYIYMYKKDFALNNQQWKIITLNHMSMNY